MADAAKDGNQLFAERKHVALVIDETGEKKKAVSQSELVINIVVI